MSIISQTYDKDMIEPKQKKERKPSNKVLISEVISYLNSKTKSDFKTSSQATVKLLNGRIAEGYTLEDFKSVIDLKISKWGNDPKMQEFIRPITLFSTKFE